jgi:hypothetical protein
MTADKRAVVGQLRSEAPVRQLCTMFDCPRSSYYYQPARPHDEPLLTAIEQVLMRQPWFGYRRVVAQLQRDGQSVGETRVRRLLNQLQRTRSVGTVKVTTTASRHAYTRYTNLIRGVQATWPDQIWVADITYIRLGLRFMYLAVILDACSRAVRGWALSRSMSQEVALECAEHGAGVWPTADLSF